MPRILCCHSEPFDFAQDRLRRESSGWGSREMDGKAEG
jgi:hypothetical protein